MLNMRTVAQVIEMFNAENGYYASDFYEDGYGYLFPGGTQDIQLGHFPTNPYTGEEMEPDEMNPWDYDADVDVSNTSAGGPNDDWGYSPGEIRYGTYTPPGATNPTLWGLIGFDSHGFAIRSFDADNNVVIFVLHG